MKEIRCHNTGYPGTTGAPCNEVMERKFVSGMPWMVGQKCMKCPKCQFELYTEDPKAKIHSEFKTAIRRLSESLTEVSNAVVALLETEDE